MNHEFDPEDQDGGRPAGEEPGRRRSPLPTYIAVAAIVAAVLASAYYIGSIKTGGVQMKERYPVKDLRQ